MASLHEEAVTPGGGTDSAVCCVMGSQHFPSSWGLRNSHARLVRAHISQSSGSWKGQRDGSPGMLLAGPCWHHDCCQDDHGPTGLSLINPRE